MIEFAVFTKEIVEELILRGFNPIRRSSLAWFFEDSVLLESCLGELTAELAAGSE